LIFFHHLAYLNVIWDGRVFSTVFSLLVLLVLKAALLVLNLAVCEWSSGEWGERGGANKEGVQIFVMAEGAAKCVSLFFVNQLVRL